MGFENAIVHETRFEAEALGFEKLGTENDQQGMVRMGKKQELRRNFRFGSIWGYAVILGCLWEFSLIDGVLSLPNGGTAGSIWMSLITCIGMFLVTLSMAELASMAPTAGGQYHWCSEFAPKRFQKFLSYAVGFMCVLGWQSGLAAVCFVSAQHVNAMVIVAHPEYVASSWQTALIAWAVLGIAILFITLLFRNLPTIENMMMALDVCGFFAVIVVLWVTAPLGDTTVFTSFQTNGWSSPGLACLVGLNAAIGNVIGADASVHLSEELKNASWALPRSMIATSGMNYVLSFVTVVTLAFCLGDYDDAVNSPIGQPYIQVILNATGSQAATIILTLLVLIMLISCGVNNVTTSSRQLWSFARDGGPPFSPWFAKVHPKWDIPVNALVVSAIVTIVLTCISIGSTEAYTIFLTLNLSGLLTSYLICICCVLYKRLRNERFPPSKFHLGRAATPVNIAAILFQLVVLVFQFFPFAPSPGAEGMNWSVVLYFSVIAFFTVYYILRARHRYVGPAVSVRRNE